MPLRHAFNLGELMLIKNVFIEGPDCSGKTTVINKIHKNTNYKYNL